MTNYLAHASSWRYAPRLHMRPKVGNATVTYNVLKERQPKLVVEKVLSKEKHVADSEIFEEHSSVTRGSTAEME